MQTGGPIQERRQGPRTTVSPSPECLLEVRARVRMIDISLTGTLLATPVPLPVGTQAHLRSNVGPSSFAPAVQVRRFGDVLGRGATGGIGVMFTSMDDRSRRSLEDFLRKATV